jgi:hypothetical protein
MVADLRLLRSNLLLLLLLLLLWVSATTGGGDSYTGSSWPQVPKVLQASAAKNRDCCC